MGPIPTTRPPQYVTHDRAWPTASQYLKAIQTPARAFTDPFLRSAIFVRDRWGLPQAAEGQNAIAYPAETAHGPIVVRCFKRLPVHAAQRYQALSAAPREVSPAFARCHWADDGISVAGSRWPLVVMERIDGVPLGAFIEGHLQCPGDLLRLADRWRELMAELADATVAHADLHQDNVRITPDGTIRLIDLDAVWLPATARLAPAERGHRAFQHPQRTREGHWDRWVDAFSALVIHLSLTALAADPQLWAHHHGENLIFDGADFRRPELTPIWAQLASSPSPQVRDQTALLAEFCRRTAHLRTTLETLLSTGTLPPAAAWSAAGLATDDVNDTEWWWNDRDDSRTSEAAGQTEGTVPLDDWWAIAAPQTPREIEAGLVSQAGQLIPGAASPPPKARDRRVHEKDALRVVLIGGVVAIMIAAAISWTLVLVRFS